MSSKLTFNLNILQWSQNEKIGDLRLLELFEAREIRIKMNSKEETLRMRLKVFDMIINNIVCCMYIQPQPDKYTTNLQNFYNNFSPLLIKYFFVTNGD